MKSLVFFLWIFLLGWSCSTPENEKVLEYWEKDSPKTILTDTYDGTYYKHYYSNGTIAAKGIRIDEQREKVWLDYYEAGQLKSETNYRANQKFGLSKEFYPDGSLKSEGKYNEFEKEQGLWTFYHQTGGIYQTGYFENGKRIRTWSEFSDAGKPAQTQIFSNPDDLITEYNYVADSIYYKEYYPRGPVKMTGFTKPNDIDSKFGDWIYYFESGEVKAEGSFENGKKIGNWKYWHSNGKKAAEGEYFGGVQHEISMKKSKNWRIKKLPISSYESGGMKVGNWKYWHPNGKKMATIRYKIKNNVHQTIVLSYKK